MNPEENADDVVAYAAEQDAVPNREFLVITAVTVGRRQPNDTP
ncbi:hypothetical protein P3W24_03475 [Luteibacter sp. PPL201]|jgi:hypothetical protein|uniref:Uncharacterized protein n=1 Tax=Luteibacter sahnii TaxID=3021977 RepID=A0ABT6B7G6_9GAMM|nr:hypothetical protein [Luteibacter sp. PPL193]MDY1548015.1 hypothetical protein [Luteibacter sp. PPL193]